MPGGRATASTGTGYYGGDLTIKKWFGKKAQGKPFSGHHIGPYFQMLTYDFELGGKGYQA